MLIFQDNILVSESGDARICDFGCSRMISASLSMANLSSSPKGTLRYLACELITGKTGYTRETDVWAFGMTIFVSSVTILSMQNNRTERRIEGARKLATSLRGTH